MVDGFGEEIVVADIEEAESDFSPLPPGDYVVMIVASEIKENNAKTGQYLKLEMDVQEGEYQGRKIFDYLNFRNPSEKASAIAWTHIKQIALSIGIAKFSSPAELHNKRLVASVKVQEGTEYTDSEGVTKMGNPSNQVTKYSAYGSSSAPAQETNSTAEEENVKPWQRKSA